ncbi:CHAT domain-containing protein [Mycena galericulata]|nr:CHAT domain-containing protein [Mycena galericulata]
MSTQAVTNSEEQVAESVPQEVATSDDSTITKMEQQVAETPQGHPDLPGYLLELGNALIQRHLSSGNLNDLVRALQSNQDALTLISSDNPEKALYLYGVATAFGIRYQRFGDLPDLEEAMQKSQEAVDITSTDPIAGAGYLQNLAVCFTERYERLGDMKDLDAALQINQEAVDLTPTDHPGRAIILQGLAVSSRDRYERLGQTEDLERALQSDQEALTLTPKDNPERAGCLQSLAISLKHRYRRFGDPKDLEAALQYNQEALDLTPADDPDRALCLQGLATSLMQKYEQFGDLKDLESALKNDQEALDLTPEDHPDRAAQLHNLGSTFRKRFERLSDLKDLEQALQKDQRALELTPSDHPDRVKFLRSLSHSFRDRYERLGLLRDLEAALNGMQEAIALTPAHHPYHIQLLQALSVCFNSRYQRLGDAKDLEAALKSDQEALDLLPENHPDRAGHLTSLAFSFRSCYLRFGNLKDLEEALHKDQAAVDLTLSGHPLKAQYLHNLAASLGSRYLKLGDIEDLEATLQRAQEALDETPVDHPDRAERLQVLATSLLDKYHQLREWKDLEAALQKGQEALSLVLPDHPDRAKHLQSLASTFRHRFRKTQDLKDLQAVHTYYSASFNTQASPSNPEQSWTAALEWASFSEEFEPAYCLAAYSEAFRILPEIIWIGHNIPVRHEAIRRLDIGRIASTATRTCIKLSNLTSAVEIMEQAVATTFQQMLQLKTDVDVLPSEEAEELKKLSFDLYSGTATDPQQVARKRNELLEKIRKEPGLQYFLLPKPYTALALASQNGPIVVLNSLKHGCDGIIIANPTSEPVRVPLPNVTLEVLKMQQTKLKELLGRCNVRNRGQSAATRLFGCQEGFFSKSTGECFAEILAWLWTHVVSPVYQTLESLGITGGRMWWLPTGAFTGLPLHASSPNKQFIHSYTPTLGSLLEAHSKNLSSVNHKFGVVGVTHTGPGRENYLRGVGQELQNIRSVVSHAQCLEGEKATPDAVKHLLEDCSWVHLACHGTQDLINPTKSCLLLYGGILELDTILKMPLSNAELVFLAACQTAMGDSELVNESFHLGGGLIAAGFRGAIGTLWSMNDADGPPVAKNVYSHLFRDGKHPQASDAAEALQLAVDELKAQNVSYERWIPFIHLGV